MEEQRWRDKAIELLTSFCATRVTERELGGVLLTQLSDCTNTALHCVHG